MFPLNLLNNFSPDDLAGDGKNARASSRPEPIVGKLGALHTRCPAEVAIDWLDRHDGGGGERFGRRATPCSQNPSRETERNRKVRYARAPTDMMPRAILTPLWRRRKLTGPPLPTFWTIPVACPSTKEKASLRKQNLPPRGK
jgi:hypothetical protein